MDQSSENKWRRLTVDVRVKIAEILDCADDIHAEICEQGSGFDAEDLWKIETKTYEIARCVRELRKSADIYGQKEE